MNMMLEIRNMIAMLEQRVGSDKILYHLAEFRDIKQQIRKGIYPKIRIRRFFTELRKTILIIDRNRVNKIVCRECGTGENLHLHHTEYKKLGEIHVLCEHCHRQTHKNDILPK